MAAIENLMASSMITASPGETVAEVADRMNRNGVGAVLLVEGDRLVGLFSERDLLTRVVALGKDPKHTRVGDVATRDVVTIEIDHPLREVLAVFRDGRFRHLPVVKDGKPVGILSTRDFLAYLVDEFERYIDELRYRKLLEEGTDPYDHFGGSYGR